MVPVFTVWTRTRVTETMLIRHEIRDAIDGITAPREPGDLLGSEPQLLDGRVVERQLVRHSAEEYSREP